MRPLIVQLFFSIAHAGTAPVNIGVHKAGSNSIDPIGALSTVGGSIINALTYIAGSAAVIFLMYYGIKYITSQGSPEKTKSARAGVINAILGIIIITASNGIIRFSLYGSRIVSSSLSGNSLSNSGATHETTPDQDSGTTIVVPGTVPTQLTPARRKELSDFINSYHYRNFADPFNPVGTSKWCRDSNNCLLEATFQTFKSCVNNATTEEMVDSCKATARATDSQNGFDFGF